MGAKRGLDVAVIFLSDAHARLDRFSNARVDGIYKRFIDKSTEKLSDRYFIQEKEEKWTNKKNPSLPVLPRVIRINSIGLTRISFAIATTIFIFLWFSIFAN